MDIDYDNEVKFWIKDIHYIWIQGTSFDTCLRLYLIEDTLSIFDEVGEITNIDILESYKTEEGKILDEVFSLLPSSNECSQLVRNYFGVWFLYDGKHPALIEDYLEKVFPDGVKWSIRMNGKLSKGFITRKHIDEVVEISGPYGKIYQMFYNKQISEVPPTDIDAEIKTQNSTYKNMLVLKVQKKKGEYSIEQIFYQALEKHLVLYQKDNTSRYINSYIMKYPHIYKGDSKWEFTKPLSISSAMYTYELAEKLRVPFLKKEILASEKPTPIFNPFEIGETSGSSTIEDPELQKGYIFIHDQPMNMVLYEDAINKKDKFKSVQDFVCFSAIQGVRLYMEDRMVIAELGKDIWLYGILDGHAGYAAAEWFSENIPLKLQRNLKQLEGTRYVFTHIKQIIIDTILELDKEWFNAHNLSHPFTYNAGTTFTGALITYYDIITINVGDSRTIIRTPDNEIISTKDHKPGDPEERKRIVKEGGNVTPDGAGILRVNGILAMSRALGDNSLKLKNKPSEYAGINAYVSPLPDVTKITKQKGDVIVMASDGLFDVIENEEVFRTYNRYVKEGSQNICNSLMNVALSSGDNASVMILKIQ